MTYDPTEAVAHAVRLDRLMVNEFINIDIDTDTPNVPRGGMDAFYAAREAMHKHFRDSLVAAYEAGRPKWQPIETAPKDGSQIMLASPSSISIGRWNDRMRGPGASGYIQQPGWIACAMGEDVPDEGWDTGNGYSLEMTAWDEAPTHWMPLPAAPQEGQA